MGAKFNHKTGDVTLYYKVDPKISISAGFPLGGTANGSVMIAVTRHKGADGVYRPSQLQLTATGTVAANFDVSGKWQSVSQVGDARHRGDAALNRRVTVTFNK